MDTKTQELFAFVDQLPHAMHIPAEVRLKWIESTVALGDHDPMWHARRLRGIGSSEIGCCVESARGHFTPFQGARDVVLSKLMRLAPDAGTGHTRRGNAMEAMVQQLFHQKFGTRSETGMMTAMRDFVVPDAPWMVGNPDDLCMIDGKLYIVDYKAPMPETLEETRKGDGVNFEYVCQLHHLQHIGQAGGLPIEGRLLCALDYAGWDVDVREVAFDEALLDEMKAVGNELWYEFVLKGEVPATVPKPEFDGMSKEDFQLLMRLSEKFVILHTVASTAKKETEAVATEIAAITKNYRMDNARIDLVGGRVAAKQSIDKEVLMALSQRHGLVLDLDDETSIEKTIESLDILGESRKRYMEEVSSFSMSRAKQGRNAEMITDCKERGQALLETHVKALSGKYQPTQDEVTEVEEKSNSKAKATSRSKVAVA